MRTFLQLTKITVVLSLIGLFLLVSFLASLVIFDQWRLKRTLSWLVHKFCRLGLRVMGIEVRAEGPVYSENGLIVSNHLSYLDILVQSAQRPTCFVTSVEIKQTPFLGQICTLAGCLFVERRSRENLRKEILEITEALENGLNVTIFPEATSTNGEGVIRFRRPLFSAAVFSGRPVIPVCLNYDRLDESALTTRTRDDVCWYGDMDFLPHLWRFVGHRRLEARLSYFAPIETADREPAGLSEQAYALIRDRFVPVKAEDARTPDLGLDAASITPRPSP